ncbi:MAG: M56 family metallopeptidase [Fuerstiella sp.]
MLHSISEVIPATRLSLVVLLHFIWQATCIITIVAVAQNLIHPRFFRARYIMSVSGLVVVLLAPFATASYYLTNTEALVALSPPAMLTDDAPLVAIGFEANGASWLEAQFQVVFQWFDSNRLFWLGSWLAGFVVLLMRLSISLGHCVRLRRSHRPLPPHLEKLANQFKSKLKITRNVVVAHTQGITQAVATGVIKPMVLIPTAWVTQLPISSIEAVLAHELSHVKRWDLWINLLQRCAETVFFSHPFVWWLSQRISNEREVCCDQLAVRVTGQPVQYVETLSRVASGQTFEEFTFQFGTAFVGDKQMNLLRRVTMILEPASVDAHSPGRVLSLVACIGLLATYGSFAYSQAPNPAALTVQDDKHKTHEIIDRADEEKQVREVAKDLRRHVSKLAANGNTEALARQLRQLADQLDSKHDKRGSQTEELHVENKNGRITYRIRGRDGERHEILFSSDENPERIRVEGRLIELHLKHGDLEAERDRIEIFKKHKLHELGKLHEELKGLERHGLPELIEKLKSHRLHELKELHLKHETLEPHKVHERLKSLRTFESIESVEPHERLGAHLILKSLAPHESHEDKKVHEIHLLAPERVKRMLKKIDSGREDLQAAHERIEILKKHGLHEPGEEREKLNKHELIKRHEEVRVHTLHGLPEKIKEQVLHELKKLHLNHEGHELHQLLEDLESNKAHEQHGPGEPHEIYEFVDIDGIHEVIRLHEKQITGPGEARRVVIHFESSHEAPHAEHDRTQVRHEAHARGVEEVARTLIDLRTRYAELKAEHDRLLKLHERGKKNATGGEKKKRVLIEIQSPDETPRKDHQVLIELLERDEDDLANEEQVAPVPIEAEIEIRTEAEVEAEAEAEI